MAMPAAGQPFNPVRLTGSARAGAGRLEVFANDTWAAVAPSASSATSASWDWLVSKVCQEQGFLRGASFAGFIFKPSGSLPQWNTVACLSNETNASACMWGSLSSGNESSPDINMMCTNDAAGEF